MGVIERLRRPDWLRELQSVLTVVLVVLAGLGVLGAAALVVGDAIVAEVPTSAVTGVPGAVPPGVAIDPDGTVDVVVADPDGRQLVAKALTGAPTYLVVLTMVVLLLGVVRRARRDDPFLPATVRRLRLLAVVVLVGGPAAFIVETIAALDLSSRVTTAYVGTTVDLSPVGSWLLVGFGLLAIAEVLNRGRAMRAELDTVV